jgi:hypothetical protein
VAPWACRRRPPIAGGIASRTRACPSFGQEAGSVIAPRGLAVNRVASARLKRSRSCECAERPVLDRGVLPGSSAVLARRSGKVLHHHGPSRRASACRQSSPRYEWSRPGALLHVDTTRLGRFALPGHKVLGRSTASRSRRPPAWLRLPACLHRRSFALRLRGAAPRRACRTWSRR